MISLVSVFTSRFSMWATFVSLLPSQQSLVGSICWCRCRLPPLARRLIGAITIGGPSLLRRFFSFFLSHFYQLLYTGLAREQSGSKRLTAEDENLLWTGLIEGDRSC